MISFSKQTSIQEQWKNKAGLKQENIKIYLSVSCFLEHIVACFNWAYMIFLALSKLKFNIHEPILNFWWTEYTTLGGEEQMELNWAHLDQLTHYSYYNIHVEKR